MWSDESAGELAEVTRPTALPLQSVTIDPSAFVVAAGGGQAPGGDAAATVEGEQTSAVVAVA